MILYSLYNNIAIFRVKKITPSKLGEMGLQKMKIDDLFFFLNHGKIAHGLSFSPKIFLDPYYKYVNRDDKLKSNVFTSNGEAPKSYPTLTTTSISSASMTEIWESWVSLDTTCKCVHVNCQIIKIEIIYETIGNCDIKNNRLYEERV